VIHFDIANLELELKELEEKTNSPDFWQNPEKSTPILTKIKGIQNKLEKYNKIQSELLNIENLNDLLILEYDKELSEELISNTNSLEKEIDKLEIQTLLSGKYDKNNAILTLHPGAGGTESQDWAEMLYRMYSKWSVSNGYVVKELDYLEGDEAGIKSVTFSVSGENAYGYLKSEMGVHRLVRISPFDSGGRRHTSFASLEVLPEITEDIVLEINSDDLRIDTYRASRSRRTTY
jgi:peptide chain release factor 2